MLQGDLEYVRRTNTHIDFNFFNGVGMKKTKKRRELQIGEMVVKFLDRPSKSQYRTGLLCFTLLFLLLWWLKDNSYGCIKDCFHILLWFRTAFNISRCIDQLPKLFSLSSGNGHSTRMVNKELLVIPKNAKVWPSQLLWLVINDRHLHGHSMQDI